MKRGGNAGRSGGACRRGETGRSRQQKALHDEHDCDASRDRCADEGFLPPVKSPHKYSSSNAPRPRSTRAAGDGQSVAEGADPQAQSDSANRARKGQISCEHLSHSRFKSAEAATRSDRPMRILFSRA
jgi:hypothetical protein